MRRRSAFTLIELLIVIGIIALLIGLCMPLLTLVQRSAKRSNTQAVMGKADLALRLFKQELLFHPYQRVYPPLGDTTGWSNQLARILGSDLSATTAAAVRVDMDVAASRYNYALTNGGWAEPPINAANVHVLRDDRGNGATVSFAAINAGLGMNAIGSIPETDLRPTRWWWNGSRYLATYPRADDGNGNVKGMQALTQLNHLAAERARLVIASGYYDAPGLVIPAARSPDGLQVHPGRDCSGSRLVPTPAADGSAYKPGLTGDYLERGIDRRFIAADGETLLDAWGRPIIYLCQVVPGVRGASASYKGWYFADLKTRAYGMDVAGRASLARLDAESGQPLGAQPPHLPDPAVPRHSSSTRFAAPGNELEFELWSAGPDGLFDAMRDGPANRDNLGYRAYDKGIEP